MCFENADLSPQELYHLVEEDGAISVVIHEGVTSLVEYPMMPKLFVPNEKVTQIYIPNSLESVYVPFWDYFPRCGVVREKEDHPKRNQFRSEIQYFCSEEHPKAVPPNFLDNGDGTYTLDIPEGVYTVDALRLTPIYRQVTVVRFPASLQSFDMQNIYHFDALQAFCVHPDNPHFSIEDGVLFSADKKKIIKYLRCKEGDTYRMGDNIEVIGSYCFTELDNLKNLYIGKGVRKIEDCALVRDTRFDLKRVYIPPTVTELEGEIFDVVYDYDDGGRYYPIEIVGGAKGSAIEAYCTRRGIDFVEVAEDQVDQFYAATEEELRQLAKEQARLETEFWMDESEKGYRMHFTDGTLEETEIADFLATPLVDEDDDPYLAVCQKMMIVDEYGVLQQVGEVGEELVFPEGVEVTCDRINLSPCKKVVIPSSLTNIWTPGLDGPANDLAEFVVSADNPRYTAIEGHLCTDDGCLMTYAPAAKVPGRLPEGITAIDEYAFQLMDRPVQTLYIPSSVTKVCSLGLRFLEVRVHPDNTEFRALDGNLVSADGKELVCAKVSLDDYQVPDGVARIGLYALHSVSGRLMIPESVTQIAESLFLPYNVVVRVTKGSYGERYMQQLCAQRPQLEVEVLCPDGSVEKMDPAATLENDFDSSGNEYFGADLSCNGEIPF